LSTQRRRFNHIVDILTGGSPLIFSMIVEHGTPPAKVIKEMEELGFHVTHVYGMTETQGPTTLCVPQDHWVDLPSEQRAVLNARQGMRYPVMTRGGFFRRASAGPTCAAYSRSVISTLASPCFRM
jgi:fatty-acyl-CoA synthase